MPEHRAQLPDAFVPFLDYCRQRLADDPRLWASTLFAEVCDLGYQGAYSTFTRALRRHRVRPHCEPCRAATGRDVAVITHPPGEEIQFDRLELPDRLWDGASAPMPTRWSVHSLIQAAGGRCRRRLKTSRTWCSQRTVRPQGLVCFDGNQYSVPPGLPAAQVKVLHRLGEDYLHILTVGRAVAAEHRRAPSGSG
ncbi:hypothetical protein ABZ667_26625 [Streptomyces lavendulae]|uniref:Mu transposase domain-containing protein n=1 Tax=Streptomyces lavendulae TaxID=1914 RepID=UPI0033D930C2